MHKADAFKVGQIVRVVQEVEDGCGWENAWNSDFMTPLVGDGKLYVISEAVGDRGFRLKLAKRNAQDASAVANGCMFPSDALELAEFKVGDYVTAVDVPASDAGWCNATISGRTKPKIVGKKCKVRQVTRGEGGCWGLIAYILDESDGTHLDGAQVVAWAKEEVEPKSVRKVAFKLLNKKRCDTLESEIGERGSATKASIKLRMWACAAAGIDLSVLDESDVDVVAAYNDVSNKAIATISKELGTGIGVSLEAAKMAQAIVNALPTNESKLLEIVDKMVDAKMAPRVIAMFRDESTGILVKKDLGLQHYKIEVLLAFIRARVHCALVGGAGTGKTTAGQSVADIVGLKFYPKSFTRMTTESALMGYKDAGGAYHRTVFRDAFEHGGVFLCDEADNANENVLGCLNAALANDFCSFPDGVVKRHPDFICILGMNTYGNGGNRIFVGRNELDGATKDRFGMVDWDIDAAIESHMAGLEEGRPMYDIAEGGVVTKEKWLAYVRDVRQAVEAAEVRHIVSPRATLFGCKLIDQGVGIEVLDESLIWKGMDAEQKERVKAQLKGTQPVGSKPKPKAKDLSVNDVVPAGVQEVPF